MYKGQKFKCYILTKSFADRGGRLVESHMSLGGVDLTGESAFKGRVFICGDTHRLACGVAIVCDMSGEYEFRDDHFRFETIDATA